MKRFAFILASMLVITSCEKEEEQKDPCSPYTFVLSDGDRFSITHSNNGQAMNPTFGNFNGVAARYVGCLKDSGRIYNVAGDSIPFGNSGYGSFTYRPFESSIVYGGSIYDIESESANKLVATFGSQRTLTMTK